MAQDLEQLVLSISADTRQIQRALKKLEGDTNASTRKVERNFDALGKRVNGVFAGIGRSAKGFLAGIAGAFTVREAQQLIDASTRIDNALKVAGLEGEALTKVYDRLFESAQRNATPIEALVDLYSRASLSAKELGISQEELLRFTDQIAVALRVNGKSAAESSGALLQLAQALGSGVVRAEEFNSVQEGALPILQAVAAGLEEAGGSVAKLRALVVDGQVSSEAFFRAFEAGSVILEEKVAGAELTVSQGFVRLQNVLIKTAGELNTATGASDAAGEALNRLATAVESLGDFIVRLADGPLGQFLGMLGELDRRAQSAWETLSKFTFNDDIARWLGATLAPEGTGPDNVRVAGGKTGAVKSPIDRRIDAAFVASSGGAVSLKDFTVPDDGAAAKRASEYEKAKKAIDDTIASLQFEQQQLSRSAVAQRTYNELKRAGVELSSQAGQQIANLVAQIEAETQTIEANTEAQEKRAESLDNLFQMGTDALTSIADGSVKAEDALKKLILQLALAAAQASLLGTGPLAGLFGGFKPTAGGFANMLGIPGYAKGTSNHPGGLAIVGEKGPELLNLPKGSQVIPNVPKLPSMASAAGSGGVVVNFAPVIDNRGASVEAVARNEQQLAKMKAELPALVIASVRNANSRRVKFG